MSKRSHSTTLALLALLALFALAACCTLVAGDSSAASSAASSSARGDSLHALLSSDFVPLRALIDSPLNSPAALEREAETEALDHGADAEAAAESNDDGVLMETASQAESRVDAQLEPLYAALRDARIDPEVRRFLSRSALRSEDAQLAALERGALRFDERGDDVLLEHTASDGAVLDDDLEAAIRRRIEQKWRSEKYYANPQASDEPAWKPDDTAQLTMFLEADAQIEAQAKAEAEAEAEIDAVMQEAVEAEVDAEDQLLMELEEQLETEADADADVDADADAETDAFADLDLDRVLDAADPDGVQRSMDAEAQAAEIDDDGRPAVRVADPSEPLPATAFLLELESQFTPEQATKHRASHINQARYKRLRARRHARAHNTESALADSNPVAGEQLDAFGLYDERKAGEESRTLDAQTVAGLHAERLQRRGSTRDEGLSPAPFCATYPWCRETPPPPSLANMPPSEDVEFARRELAKLDPTRDLPPHIEQLTKDPHRFGIVIQSIYERAEKNQQTQQQTQQA